LISEHKRHKYEKEEIDSYVNENMDAPGL